MDPMLYALPLYDNCNNKVENRKLSYILPFLTFVSMITLAFTSKKQLFDVILSYLAASPSHVRIFKISGTLITNLIQHLSSPKMSAR